MSEEGEEETPLHPFLSLLYISLGLPNDLPPSLPRLGGIEHQIDLLPRATLPNKLTYRCNPTETKELQQQVQQLIDRGYIREYESLFYFSLTYA